MSELYGLTSLGLECMVYGAGLEPSSINPHRFGCGLSQF